MRGGKQEGGEVVEIEGETFLSLPSPPDAITVPSSIVQQPTRVPLFIRCSRSRTHTHICSSGGVFFMHHIIAKRSTQLGQKIIVLLVAIAIAG